MAVDNLGQCGLGGIRACETSRDAIEKRKRFVTNKGGPVLTCPRPSLRAVLARVNSDEYVSLECVRLVEAIAADMENLRKIESFMPAAVQSPPNEVLQHARHAPCPLRPSSPPVPLVPALALRSILLSAALACLRSVRLGLVLGLELGLKLGLIVG